MYLFHAVASPYLIMTLKVNAMFALINTDVPMKFERKQGKVYFFLSVWPLSFSLPCPLYCF